MAITSSLLVHSERTVSAENIIRKICGLKFSNPDPSDVVNQLGQCPNVLERVVAIAMPRSLKMFKIAQKPF